MKRQISVVVLALLIAASVAVAAFTDRAEAHPATRARPNIVFVLTDDLSTELLAEMPAVRALARRGMSFSHYVVSDSLCCPSRSSIFTGEYPHDTGIYSNDAPYGGFAGYNRNRDARHSFALTLQRAGYRTAFMGKYLNGYTPKAQVAGSAANYVAPGWNEWDGIGGGYGGFHYNVNENHRIVSYPLHVDRQYVTNVLADRASAFIASSVSARQRFMVEIATFAPHLPYVPAIRDSHKFPGLRVPRTPNFNRLVTHAPPWLARHHRRLTARQVASQDAVERKRAQSVQAVDRMIVRLERQLAAEGQLSRTVFVFSSDNGLHVGQYGLTAGKLTAFDTDIRVPLIVAGPGIPHGVTTGSIAQNVDLAPTFDALAGAQVPFWTDGESLVPVLHGGQLARNAAFIEHRPAGYVPGSPDLQPDSSGAIPTYKALRGRNYLFVHYSDGFNEYYDLTKDPYELHNVVGSLSPARLHQFLAADHAYATCHKLGCAAAGRAAPAS